MTKPQRAAVERDGGAVGVAAFAAAPSQLVNPAMASGLIVASAAAGEDGVGIAVRDGAVSLAHGVGGGGAGASPPAGVGPFAPKRMAMVPAAILAIIIGIKKGDTRPGPRLSSLCVSLTKV